MGLVAPANQSAKGNRRLVLTTGIPNTFGSSTNLSFESFLPYPPAVPMSELRAVYGATRYCLPVVDLSYGIYFEDNLFETIGEIARNTGQRGVSAALVVEVEFLFAGDWNATLGRWSEKPLLHCGDDHLIDRRIETLEQGKRCDFAVLVDDGVEDNVAFGSVSEGGEIRLRIGKALQQGDADVSFADTALRGISRTRIRLWRLRRDGFGYLCAASGTDVAFALPAVNDGVRCCRLAAARAVNVNSFFMLVILS